MKKKTHNPPAVTTKNTKSKYRLNTLWIKRAYMIRKRDNTSMIIKLLPVNHIKQIIKGWSLKSQSIMKPKKTKDSDQRSNNHEMISKTLECDQRREWKGWSFTSEHPLEREREGDSMFVCWVWEWRDRFFFTFFIEGSGSLLDKWESGKTSFLLVFTPTAPSRSFSSVVKMNALLTVKLMDLFTVRWHLGCDGPTGF